MAIWNWEIAGAYRIFAPSPLGAFVERAGGDDGPPFTLSECGEIYHASLRHRD